MEPSCTTRRGEGFFFARGVVVSTVGDPPIRETPVDVRGRPRWPPGSRSRSTPWGELPMHGVGRDGPAIRGLLGRAAVWLAAPVVISMVLAPPPGRDDRTRSEP